jgi:2-oxo-3-hexenedioate decarboxylase
MGLTSRAKMKQMGVDVPIRGFLTRAMAVGDGCEIDTSQLIHPKVEAELAFMLHRELSGPGVDAADVLSATDFVLPALEIIDSRYENFRFDLKSVIADNTSASHYVTGATSLSPHAVDLKTLGVVMYKNGEVVQTGAGAAVLGDPVMSVATLANMLGARGEVIPANTLVLTGGITAAVRVDAGDHIVTRFQHLGELSVLFG